MVALDSLHVCTVTVLRVKPGVAEKNIILVISKPTLDINQFKERKNLPCVNLIVGNKMFTKAHICNNL